MNPVCLTCRQPFAEDPAHLEYECPRCRKYVDAEPHQDAEKDSRESGCEHDAE